MLIIYVHRVTTGQLQISELTRVDDEPTTTSIHRVSDSSRGVVFTSLEKRLQVEIFLSGSLERKFRIRWISTPPDTVPHWGFLHRGEWHLCVHRERCSRDLCDPLEAIDFNTHCSLSRLSCSSQLPFLAQFEPQQMTLLLREETSDRLVRAD